ncbi:hypothetical protein GY45DRAFT_1372295 [Cubamyces sp. BRFM 1775]|nr:hypothetical protein GY45DRAFT_1372295 [Cubamyces sp. BRFM 1775]
MSIDQAVYTKAFISGFMYGSQERAMLEDSYEEDDEKVHTVEAKQDAEDEDFVCSQSSSTTDSYSSSQGSVWTCSQSSSQGSAYESLESVAEEESSYDQDDTATMIDESSDREDQLASQKTIPNGGLIADGKLNGRRLCRIAQVLKESRAPDTGFGGVPPGWRRVVKILYGLNEYEEKAAYGFVKRHVKELCPLYESTPAHWTLAHSLAQEEWEEWVRWARDA